MKIEELGEYAKKMAAEKKARVKEPFTNAECQKARMCQQHNELLMLLEWYTKSIRDKRVLSGYVIGVEGPEEGKEPSNSLSLVFVHQTNRTDKVKPRIMFHFDGESVRYQLIPDGTVVIAEGLVPETNIEEWLDEIFPKLAKPVIDNANGA